MKRISTNGLARSSSSSGRPVSLWSRDSRALKRLDVWPSLRNAPIDDEPETEQERVTVERARQSPRKLDTDHEELRRELGL
jgi:hypothetical protein